MNSRSLSAHDRRTAASALGRRAFLGAAGITTAGLLGGWRAARAMDKPQPAQPTALDFTNPGVYRFRVGDIDAFCISDGFGGAPDPTSLMLPADQHPRMIEALEDAYQSTATFPFNFNVLVARFGGEIVLFDAGNGADGMGTSGMLAARLATIGITPGDVTAVFLSHAHPDHIGGLVAEGEPAFPNATVIASNAELDFWTSEAPDLSGSPLPAEMKQGMVAGARKVVEILGDRIERIDPGSRMLGAITPQAAYGHTPGHLTYRLDSAGESLYHIVDLAHNHVLMFADPAWAIAFDTDRRMAVATRKRIFAELAAGRTRVFGYHLPFPALGYIDARDGGYAWIPENWQWQPAA